MRFHSSLFLLFVLSTLTAPLAASQDAVTSGATNSYSVITNISVAERAEGVEVEVTFSKLVQAEVSTLEHPDRLVFDFPGCALARPGQRVVVNRGSVVAVRAATFSVSPPVARVVIDLKSVQNHEEAYGGDQLIIKLNSSVTTLHSAPATSKNNGTADSQPPATKSDRTSPKSSDGELLKRTAPPPSLSANMAAFQPTAFALLAKARALTVSDLEVLEAKAQAGDAESETTLGLAYHAGTLLRADDAEARRLLEHAANRGFVAAEEALGIFYQSGFGMPPDKAQAVSWYTKAAQAGSRDAATDLAMMYSTGDGIPKDVSKAVAWFRSAADAGDATAQLNLAGLYHRGEGLPQDDAQAVLWLTKAADQSLIPAMLELAKWDMQPEHGANVDASIGWYKKAAELGDASAQTTLGGIFTDPKIGRLDYSQAVTWYRKAAEQGQTGGEFGLGSRYLLGQGVPQDLEEARRWLTPAANQGHPYAQFLLAKMLEAGQGGPADLASAAKYYGLAANSGIAEAQYRLGLLLASDRSDVSQITAYKWFVLAQDSVKESAAAADDLRKSLTPSQVAQAEREIDDWRTAHSLHPSTR